MTSAHNILAALALAAVACTTQSNAGRGGDAAVDRASDATSDGADGIGGSAGGGGVSGTGGGAGGAGGVSGTGGGGGATGGDGGPAGTQPIGSVCANTGNCSQASGAAVCCVNTCLLATDCPSNNFVACGAAPTYSCITGKCCEASAGGQTMRYCTKNNGCADGGVFLP